MLNATVATRNAAAAEGVDLTLEQVDTVLRAFVKVDLAEPGFGLLVEESMPEGQGTLFSEASGTAAPA